MYKKPSDAQIKCWPLLVAYSRWNQKASENLIGLCAPTPLSFSQQFSMSVSLPFTCMCMHICRPEDTRAQTDITTFVLPPTSKLAPTLLMHTHCCHNHLYAKRLAAKGCYGCRYQVVLQEAASCFTSYLCQFKKASVWGRRELKRK